MTTTAESLADLIVAILKTADVAGGAVYGVRAWPSDPDLCPMIELMIPEEDKVSLGRNGAQQFTVTATLPIIIRASSAENEDEEGAAAVRGELVDLCRAVERAVVNNPQLARQIQHIPFIKIHSRVNADGAEIAGQRVMLLGLEFYQGPEDFYDGAFDELEQFEAVLDAQHPADPTGDYPAPPFPGVVTAAPRTSGPDGRAEGGLSIDLTLS